MIVQAAYFEYTDGSIGWLQICGPSKPEGSDGDYIGIKIKIETPS